MTRLDRWLQLNKDIQSTPTPPPTSSSFAKTPPPITQSKKEEQPDDEPEEEEQQAVGGGDSDGVVMTECVACGDFVSDDATEDGLCQACRTCTSTSTATTTTTTTTTLTSRHCALCDAVLPSSISSTDTAPNYCESCIEAAVLSVTAWEQSAINTLGDGGTSSDSDIEELLTCPCCQLAITSTEIHKHLDECLRESGTGET